jgi:hypothetical protein
MNRPPVAASAHADEDLRPHSLRAVRAFDDADYRDPAGRGVAGEK